MSHSHVRGILAAVTVFSLSSVGYVACRSVGDAKPRPKALARPATSRPLSEVYAPNLSAYPDIVSAADRRNGAQGLRDEQVWKLQIDAPRARQIYYRWAIRETGRPDVPLVAGKISVTYLHGEPVPPATPLVVKMGTIARALPAADTMVVSVNAPHSGSDVAFANPFRGVVSWQRLHRGGRPPCTDFDGNEPIAIPMFTATGKPERGKPGRVRQMVLFLSLKPIS